MDVTVCERWRMTLDPDGGRDWFLDWALRRPHDVSAHLTAGFFAYLSLQLAYEPGELRTAREYFGGMGAQALMIQESCHPLAHTVLDVSRSAVDHLRSALDGRPVHVQQADSYAPESYVPASLVGLDFGDLTAWRLLPGQSQRALLDRVFSGAPRAVVLTDVAGPRLHLHRARYQRVLGEHGPDYPSYLSAMGWWVANTYGYAPLRTYYHRWSAVTSFVPRDASLRAGGHQINPVPDRPRGLEIL